MSKPKPTGKRIVINRLDGRVMQVYGPAITEAKKAGKITNADLSRDHTSAEAFLKELRKKGVKVWDQGAVLLNASLAAPCTAPHGVRSHAVPVALVGECSIPLV